MPIRTAKTEAASLLRSAQVSPLRVTLLFLGIRLLLDELRIALDSMIQAELPAIDPTTMEPDEMMNYFASLFAVRAPEQWSALFLSVFIALLVWVLSAGYKCYCLGVARGEQMPYESLFDAFSFAGKVLALTVLLGVLISFGLTLFVVPGVLFALIYRFALYDLCADPSIGVLTAMKRSRLQTNGRKKEVLLLLLSFLPLYLLLYAVEILVSQLLAPLFPYSLAGNLLYSLFVSLPVCGLKLFITPYFELTQAAYFLQLPQSGAQDAGISDPGT